MRDKQLNWVFLKKMNKRQESVNTLESTFLNDLSDKYGPIIGGHDLWKTLGYTSAEAFRQACFREVVPIQVFTIQNRRGRFAMTQDIAAWLSKLKE